MLGQQRTDSVQVRQCTADVDDLSRLVKWLYFVNLFTSIAIASVCCVCVCCVYRVSEVESSGRGRHSVVAVKQQSSFGSCLMDFVLFGVQDDSRSCR